MGNTSIPDGFIDIPIYTMINVDTNQSILDSYSCECVSDSHQVMKHDKVFWENDYFETNFDLLLEPMQNLFNMTIDDAEDKNLAEL